MPKRAFALAILNYTLDDDFIIPWLDDLCRAGYQGVCLHPRDGLLVPYATRLYWQRLERIIGLARERGLEVWHYDEYPYPSGSAGGLIPENHAFALAQTVYFEEIPTAPDEHGVVDIGRGALLALLRYRAAPDGTPVEWQDVTEDAGALLTSWSWGEWHNLHYTATTRVRPEVHERAAAQRFTLAYAPLEPLGNDKLLAIKARPVPGGKQQAGMPDLTLPEVTDLFLEKIYRRFRDISRRCGMVDTPVFQDEVTFYSPFPWNREIESRLRALWGADLPFKLAGLWKPGAPGWELARYEYRAACWNALETNWFARVSAWCRANGLRMAGHLPGEESIFGHAQLMGDIFKSLSHFDIPGYDIISSHLPDDENRSHAAGAKIVQSAAWLDGRKPAMVEVFACHGFHSDLQKQRTTLAWLTAQDITLTFDHTAYGSALGARKYDAPPVSNSLNPLDVARPDLWQWNNWLADLLEEYSFDPETLVLFPADAFARYQMNEVEHWQEQTTLLESWFHYVCAHSLDCVFLPSYLLGEVEPVAAGFRLRGHTFRNFLVPPVASLHEVSWNALARLREHPGFTWTLPETAREITVFGPQFPQGEQRVVRAHRVENCTETDLLARKAAWFEDSIAARVAPWRTPGTLLKSQRRHRADNSRLLLLINPHGEPVEVRSTQPFGDPIAQPPNGVESCTARLEKGEYRVTLAPRDIALFRQETGEAASVSPAGERTVLHPHELSYRFAAPNRQSLKCGEAWLQGHERTAFRPTPFSSLWKVPLPCEEVIAPYAEPRSSAPLPEPLEFAVSFPVTLDEPLAELSIFIDQESLPPQTQVCWDEESLAPQIMALIDTRNTAFAIPARHLTAGGHRVVLRGLARRGNEGVLERPILSGRFLTDGGEPLRLRALPDEWQSWDGARLWPQMGMPEGYGPVEYRMNFDIAPEQLQKSWELRLLTCIGVVEAQVNGQPVGRSAWEPRRLKIPDGVLRAGANEVHLTLHGSWNNVFSALNRLENGLTAAPLLMGV